MKIAELIATRKNRQLADYDSYFEVPELSALPRELREFFANHGASQLKPNTLDVRSRKPTRPRGIGSQLNCFESPIAFAIQNIVVVSPSWQSSPIDSRWAERDPGCQSG